MSTTVEYDILIEVLGSVKDLKKLANQTKKNKKEFDGTKKSGVSMAGSLGAAFVGLQAAAGAVVGAVQKVTGAIVGAAEASFEMTRAVVDNINDLNDLSARSSISAQNIEALKLAFESSGQSADNAKTIISQFPRALTAIQKEGSQANKILNALGVDDKKLKDGNQAFIESIRALEGIEDQTLKAQAANVIFGRSAGDLLQALGAGEFDEFTASIERYGTKAGPEASAQAAEFQKRLAAIGMIVARATQEFVINTGVMDFFINALNTAQQAIAGLNAFMKNGQSGVRALAGDVFSFLVTAFQFLGQKIGDFIMGPWLSMLRSFDTFQQKITGKSIFGEALKGIGSFIADQYELGDAIDAAKAAFDAEGEAIRGQSTSLSESTKEANKNADAAQRLIDALRGKKDATEKDTKAADKSRDRIKKQIALIKKMGQEALDAQKRIEAATIAAGKIQRDANEDLLSSLDKINQLEQDRIDNLKEITRLEGISTEEAQKAVRARADRERATQRAQDIVGGIGKVTTVIRAVMDPQSMIEAVGSAFGPIGSAVAGVVGALADLGTVDPKESKELAKELGISQEKATEKILEQRKEDIAQNFEATARGVVAGLAMLPSLLVEVLPPILFEAAGMIINAIIQLPFQLAAFIAKGFVEAFKAIGGIFTDPMKFFAGIGDAIGASLEKLWELISSPFKDLFGGDSFMSGGRFLSGQGGLRFTGASQGFAMLHSGEMVVPRSGQMSSSVARDVQAQTAGGGVTININSAITERSAIDALVRKIEDRFGSFGQSTSPLFGGQ